MIDINDLKLSELKEIASLFSPKEKDCECKKEKIWVVGKSYFIRTVTMYLVGRLKTITDRELEFENCSWVCDTGRFHDCLKNGSFNEVEPFINDVGLNRDAIIDFTIWDHSLSIKQK